MDRYYDRRVLNFDKWLHPKRIEAVCLILLPDPAGLFWVWLVGVCYRGD